jgi:hypothetical protein
MFIPAYRTFRVKKLHTVPVRLRYDKIPFLLALKATALPKSATLVLKSPLLDKSRTLKLFD